MARVNTKDGTEIFHKDWGSRQPIVFSYGWPLSGDAWDGQMLFFGQRGYRVIAHDHLAKVVLVERFQIINRLCL
jgi:non-heme chloroperoxidase